MAQRLIDADALKELKFPNGESEYVTGWNDAISAIMTFQPTIDAEPMRHGKWIKTDEYDEWYGRLYRCSNCNTFVIEDMDNYCPYCGARMDEE